MWRRPSARAGRKARTRWRRTMTSCPRCLRANDQRSLASPTNTDFSRDVPAESSTKVLENVQWLGNPVRSHVAPKRRIVNIVMNGSKTQKNGKWPWKRLKLTTSSWWSWLESRPNSWKVCTRSVSSSAPQGMLRFAFMTWKRRVAWRLILWRIRTTTVSCGWRTRRNASSEFPAKLRRLQGSS